MANYLTRIIFSLLILCTITAQAATRRIFQDIKLPTQQMIEKQTITDPVAASATRIVSGTAGATSAAVATLSTFTLQPDVPRNLVITPGGTTTDIENCVIVVAGTNIKNQAISENFTFAANDTGAQTGSKAFKTVTLVTFPADCESGGFAATWSIGVGEKIGLNKCMASAGHLVFSTVAGAYETTRATVAASASAVESNTLDFNGTMNGANDFEAFYIQNWLCN